MYKRQQQKTKSVQDRVEGFMNNIGKYGDIEVVETIYSDQVDDMEASMKEVLEKYPTLDGVFLSLIHIWSVYGKRRNDHRSESTWNGISCSCKNLLRPTGKMPDLQMKREHALVRCWRVDLSIHSVIFIRM